jgi:hypothetical protein
MSLPMKVIGQRVLISPGAVAQVAAGGCSYTGHKFRCILHLHIFLKHVFLLTFCMLP